MAIAGLIFGILSATVFWWAGPTIGGLWSASKAVSMSLAGNAGVPPAWPIWVMGLTLGVGVPLIALVISIGGLRQNKGVAIGGLVTSCVAIVLGFITTMGAAFALNVAAAAEDNSPKAASGQDDFKQLQNTLDNPAFQDKILKAMEAAGKKGAPESSGPEAATAGGEPAPATARTPDTLMPGQTPPSAPADQPAEAPNQSGFAGGTANTAPAEAPAQP